MQSTLLKNNISSGSLRKEILDIKQLCQLLLSNKVLSYQRFNFRNFPSMIIYILELINLNVGSGNRCVVELLCRCTVDLSFAKVRSVFLFLVGASGASVVVRNIAAKSEKIIKCIVNCFCVLRENFLVHFEIQLPLMLFVLRK